MRHFSANGRKTLQKLIQRVVVLQILEERLHRHSSPCKNRSAAENLGVNGDGRVGGHVHSITDSGIRVNIGRVRSPESETPRQSEAATGLRLRVDFSSGLRKFRCLLFESSLYRRVFCDPLLRRVLANVLCDFHAAEVWSTHAAEMCGLRAFLRERLTKLMPINFALIGLAVNSSLCRSIPIGSIHHEIPERAQEQNS